MFFFATAAFWNPSVIICNKFTLKVFNDNKHFIFSLYFYHFIKRNKIIESNIFCPLFKFNNPTYLFFNILDRFQENLYIYHFYKSQNKKITILPNIKNIRLSYDSFNPDNRTNSEYNVDHISFYERNTNELLFWLNNVSYLGLKTHDNEIIWMQPQLLLYYCMLIDKLRKKRKEPHTPINSFPHLFYTIENL